MQFGIRLLLLVALLLPFRGAMAVAGAWCHDPAAVPAVASADVAHHAHAVDGVHHADDAHAPLTAPDTAGDSSVAGGTCTFCCALCAAPPLPGSPVEFHPLLPSGAERFPALDPPRTTVAFGVLERPPRLG